MSDRLIAPSDQPSIHLPPPDAWKDPGKWLDKSRLEKFHPPTDDRGFVLPDATVEMVLDLFRDDYEWVYDPDDPRTKPDEHHFHSLAEAYRPEHHGGSQVPSEFRDLPSNKGWMPRQFHNALHHATYDPEVPRSMDDMARYILSHRLGSQALSRLLVSAKRTMKIQGDFRVRRQDVSLNPQRLSGREADEVGLAILASRFDKHFRVYKELLELVQTLPIDDRVFAQFDWLDTRLKPHRVVKLLGGKATREHINYVPIIGAKAA